MPSPNACGDGVIWGGEACDDHNLANNDGCSSSCSFENGWGCYSNSYLWTVCPVASNTNTITTLCEVNYDYKIEILVDETLVIFIFKDKMISFEGFANVFKIESGKISEQNFDFTYHN